MIELDGKEYALEVLNGLDGLIKLMMNKNNSLRQIILTDADGNEYPAMVCDKNMTVYIIGRMKRLPTEN